MNFVSQNNRQSKFGLARTPPLQTQAWCGAGLFLALMTTIGGAYAQSTIAGVPPPALPAIWPTLFALGAVIGAIVIFGWLMKKLNPGAANSGQLLRTVSQITIGQKERVVVIEFQNQWLVLGVTSQSVQLLSTAVAPADSLGTQASDKAMPSTGAPFSHWFNLARKQITNPAVMSSRKTDRGQ